MSCRTRAIERVQQDIGGPTGSFPDEHGWMPDPPEDWLIDHEEQQVA
jgi:hypothetical protein